MVTVTTQVPLENRNNLARLVADRSKSILEITPRSSGAILQSINHQNLALAFDQEELIGWLLATPFNDKVQEIGMAYILPRYRGRGILATMVTELIDNRPITVAATYERRLERLLCENWSFQQSSLREITLKTKGKFVFSRLHVIGSVLRHTRSARPIYLIRKNTKP